MIQNAKLPVAALGIVAGGLLLGAGLAGYADPSPKEPPAPPWANQVEPPITAGQAPITYASYPEDLSPPNLADGYAPAIANSQMRAPVDTPLPKIDMTWDKRRRTSANDAVVSTDQRDTALADERAAERAVPHYAALERAAEAPRVSDLGSDETSSEAPAVSPAGHAKLIHIADAAD